MFSRISNEPIIFLFRKAWRFAEGKRWLLILYLVFFVLSNVVSFFEPLLIGVILNELQESGLSPENFPYIAWLICGFFGLYLLFWIFHGFGRVWENNLAFLISRTYKEYLFRGVVDLPLAWHNDRDSGDTIDKINKASFALADYISSSFLVVQSLVSAIGTVVVLWFFDLWIALGVFLMVAVALWLMFLWDKILVPQYFRLNEYDNHISAKVFDALSNITSVIILRIQKVIASSTSLSFWQPFPLYRRNTWLNETKWFTVSFFFTAIVVVFLIVYLYQEMTAGRALMIGTVSSLYLYLQNSSNVFRNFGWLYSEIIQRKASVENADSLQAAISAHQKIARTSYHVHQLQIANLRFSYDTHDESAHALAVDQFEIKRGERVALIGESGSGKTTFLKVVHGLYPVVYADIAINQEYANQTFAELDLGTMLVPQEPELFSASIKENITLGMEYPEDALTQVLELARCAEFIQTLPKGLESVVNEKGVNLSGGQKQRLALARALLFVRDKQIVLLDESTSSVDPSNEARIYEGIFKTYSDKTFVASIHKMNLLRYFDRIVIFDEGKIRNEGTFAELLEKDTRFKAQWEEFQNQHTTK